ncbi:MAG: acetyl/propionyl/methylcrotonyl-CoA carboxylase subunit alpha [Phenylobacterium sp.]|uniref:acetyl/propionyl/methylcrotonyl-CoA carboxylase subunit alpha n=1 Tax=Phenylobacterium sp. TaxID=1871053 RepID=UPI0025FF62AF|nr:acetyl/propionyl/methylcrotonyl-CoA carboxylase subunit alpha [Phenylobacterium sp.]MCG9916862.1 acetyl/propionyl/methylcrotonyl-CoA carboxylase subunit alpha [Phenylobacterium sp.]
MITNLLVANRGEIARRIFRTARQMGLATVAVYSDADAGALHVREADQAVRLGPAAARESYLNVAAVLDAARASGADAVHPGYGFLSENAAFAEAVMGAGLVWVGPPPAAIRAMGLKDAAKALMIEAGVPVTPGYHGVNQDPAFLASQAKAIGYPILIKAVAGGGGKGMRKVEGPEDFAQALGAAQREAAGAFGDDRVLLETYVARPRHIEVQVFGDTHGQVVHLFERDCSLQRRHQKVIEEAPAPGMTPDVRAAVCAAAVRAAQAVDYVGAGTVEFIADASQGLRPDRIWFMEMNTRLQVEHPVTEAVTGLDLVEWQLRVAAGEPLPLGQDQITLNGWAMEARLYAENPSAGFLPSIGELEHFVLPDTVRVDTGVEAGGAVSPHYDPMIAKLIAHGPTRQVAARRLVQACGAVQVWPVRTNAGFLARTLSDEDFLRGEVDTGFIPARQAALASTPPPSQAVLSAAAQGLLSQQAGPESEPDNPWRTLTGFRLNAPPEASVRLYRDDGPVTAPLVAGPLSADVLLAADGSIVVFEAGEAFAFSGDAPAFAVGEGPAGDGVVMSPMPGKVVAVAVAQGDTVVRGQILLTLEAMKMEHALTAAFDGVVEVLSVAVGAQVSEGVVLARLTPAA